MSEMASHPAVLSSPPSEGNPQGHQPLNITITDPAELAAVYETLQRLRAGNAQAPETNIDTTSPVNSKSTDQRLMNNEMNTKTFANIDSVMRKLNLAQTPKEIAVGETRHEGDAQGNISPLTACTPTSGVFNGLWAHYVSAESRERETRLRNLKVRENHTFILLAARPTTQPQ